VVSSVEIAQPSAVSCFHHFAENLLPDPAALVFEQPAVTRLIGRSNVMGQIFPAAPGGQDVQNAIDNFTLVDPGATSGRWLRPQALETFPLGVGQIRAIGFPHGC